MKKTEKHQFWNELHSARLLLYLNDFLTEKENEHIKQKLDRYYLNNDLRNIKTIKL